LKKPKFEKKSSKIGVWGWIPQFWNLCRD